MLKELECFKFTVDSMTVYTLYFLIILMVHRVSFSQNRFSIKKGGDKFLLHKEGIGIYRGNEINTWDSYPSGYIMCL